MMKWFDRLDNWIDKSNKRLENWDNRIEAFLHSPLCIVLGWIWFILFILAVIVRNG